MGFAFHNGYEKPPEWGYVVGIFTDVNARASHALGASKVYCEETINPSNLADPGPIAKFHPKVFSHLTHNANEIRVQSNSDAERTGFRYSAGISSAWDLDPVAYRDFRLRLAPEFLIKYRGISIFTAGYAGFTDLGSPSKTELGMTGGLFQTSFRVNKTYEISIRYSIIDFKSALTDDVYERAWLLIAESEGDSDIIAQYDNAGQIRREQEMTLGFNIYMLGHTLKWQNDIGWLRHSLIDEQKDDYLARSQFQLTF